MVAAVAETADKMVILPESVQSRKKAETAAGTVVKMVTSPVNAPIRENHKVPVEPATRKAIIQQIVLKTKVC